MYVCRCDQFACLIMQTLYYIISRACICTCINMFINLVTFLLILLSFVYETTFNPCMDTFEIFSCGRRMLNNSLQIKNTILGIVKRKRKYHENRSILLLFRMFSILL